MGKRADIYAKTLQGFNAFPSSLCVALVKVARPQWNLLRTFHRVALRLRLGISYFAGNIATLTEAEDEPLQLYAEK